VVRSGKKGRSGKDLEGSISFPSETGLGREQGGAFKRWGGITHRLTGKERKEEGEKKKPGHAIEGIACERDGKKKGERALAALRS